jgi:hypothetical protein
LHLCERRVDRVRGQVGRDQRLARHVVAAVDDMPRAGNLLDATSDLGNHLRVTEDG